MQYTDYPAYFQDCPVLNFVTAGRVELGNADHEPVNIERTFGMKRTLATLLFLGFFIAGTGAAPAQPGPPARAGRPAVRALHRQALMEKLNLTDAQKKQLDAMRTEMQKKSVEVRGKIQLARIDLRDLMHADDPDRTAIRKKLDEIASLRTQQQLARIDHWFDVRKILTPEQQKIWKSDLRGLMMDHGRQWGDRRGMMGMSQHGMQTCPCMTDRPSETPENDE